MSKREPFTRRSPARVMPQIWFCPSPGAEDAQEVLLAQTPHGVQLYTFVMQAMTPAYFGVNTRPNFEATGVLESCFARQIPILLETPAVKEPEQNDGRLIDAAIDGVRWALRLGAPSVGVVMDEPIYAGLTFSTPPMAVAELVERIDTFVGQVSAVAPVGLVEAYPGTPLRTLIDVLNGLQRVPLCVHLDVDHNAIKATKATAAADFETLHRYLRSRGIPFGVVVWGCDDRDEASFLASARALFGFYQQCFADGDWPERVIVQSWSRDGQAVRTIPSAAALWSLWVEIQQALEPERL